jgi:outer membrane protein assembly factor BamB
MKLMESITFMLLTSLLFGACRQPAPFSPDPPIVEQDTVFELAWATRMDYEKEIVGTDNTQQYKDLLLIGGDIGFPPTVLAFNKDTGEKEWEYVHEGAIKDEIDVSYVFEGIYVGMCSSGIVGIDLDTRATLWEINLYEMNMTRGYTFEMFDGHLYFYSVWGLGSSNQNTKLFQLDPYSGQIEVVFQTSNGTINPPIFYQNGDSETDIIFNEYPQENDLPEESVQNLVRLHLDTGREVWRNDSISQFYNSNVLHPAILYDNRIVITGGDWSIYAFDLQTGARLWRYEFDYPWAIWTKTNHLIHDGRLYVNNSQFDVTCLNPETGELIWNNPKGGPNCTDNMVYYEKEDLLVFTSWGYGSVMVLDALTGETLHREHRFDNSSYNNDVVYDEERDMFFTSTYKHAIGFRVRRP